MKVIFEKIIRFLLRHPWSSLFGVVLFFIILTFLPFGGDEKKQTASSQKEKVQKEQKAAGVNESDSFPEQKNPDPLPLVPDNSDKKRDTSSPYDNNPDRRRAAVRDIAEDPAVQFLPYRGALILADIADRLGDKLVVRVYYMGDRSFAEREWREFLSSHGDDGSSYQVVYIEKK